MTVTIGGIDKYGQRLSKVVDILASAGVSSLYGLSYDTENPNEGKALARNLAWADAVAKAKQYAQLSGRKLGKVIIIEETSTLYSPYYYATEQQQTSIQSSS